MVQQVAVSTADEQRPPREPRRRPHAAVPDLIVAARRRRGLLAGARARLRASLGPILYTSHSTILLDYVLVKRTVLVLLGNSRSI